MRRVDGGMGGETATSARVAKDGKRCVGFSVFFTRAENGRKKFSLVFLKPAFAPNALCGNQYMGVKMDPSDPRCHFLATHDDYSLVERFREQPRVVTMLRKPSSRALSSYEFSIEVASRSLGGAEREARENSRGVAVECAHATHGCVTSRLQRDHQKG